MDDEKTKATQTNLKPALFKTGLWAESFSLIKRNPKASLTYFAASSAVTWLGGENLSDAAGVGLEAFVTVFLLLPICVSLLKQSHDASAFGRATNPHVLNFTLRTLAMNFAAFVPGALIAIVMLAYRFSPEAGSGALLFAYLIMLIIVYSKWGTMLPAIVDDADFTFKTAGDRGRKTWSFAFANLLVPYVLVILLFIMLMIPAIILSDGNGQFYSALTGYDFFVLYENTIISLMGILVTVMTAVVLTRSYLLAEGRTVA
jgi:hypothetical protein